MEKFHYGSRGKVPGWKPQAIWGNPQNGGTRLRPTFKAFGLDISYAPFSYFGHQHSRQRRIYLSSYLEWLSDMEKNDLGVDHRARDRQHNWADNTIKNLRKKSVDKNRSHGGNTHVYRKSWQLAHLNDD